MKELMSRPYLVLAWRIYASVTVVIFILSFFLFPQTPVQFAIDTFWIVGLVPLYGYLEQVPILSPELWRVYFVVSVSAFVGQFLYAFYTVGAAILPELQATLNGVLFALIFVAPMFWANYAYAFRSPHLWTSSANG
jgi:hypothetical protein